MIGLRTARPALCNGDGMYSAVDRAVRYDAPAMQILGRRRLRLVTTGTTAALVLAGPSSRPLHGAPAP